MRQVMLFLTCAAAAVMLGCVPSLQPLYSEKDPILLAPLAGTWVSEDGKDKFTFKADEQDIKYDITCIGEKGSGKLEARLLRLGKHLFLDTTVNDLPDTKSDYPQVPPPAGPPDHKDLNRGRCPALRHAQRRVDQERH